MAGRRTRATARRPRRKGKPRGLTGRPPTGIRPGERLIDYKQVTVRLPPETVAQLEALAAKLERPQWRVVVEALAAYQATVEAARVAPGGGQQHRERGVRNGR